jgi:putative ABC transport system permease protein
MFKNFFLLATRNFLRHRFYSAINLLGLTTGMVTILLIYVWVNDEWQMNKFHKDSNKIFRIVSNMISGDGNIITWNVTPGKLGEDIRENSAEVEMVVRTMYNGKQLFEVEDKSFLEPGYFADPEFFELFSYAILKGTVRPVEDKNSVAISERLAQKLFGQEDPIGQTVKVAGQYDLEVKAIFENVSSRSSMKFDFIMPFDIYKEQRGNGYNWGNYDHPLYVKLFDPKKAAEAIEKINQRRASLEGMNDNVDFYIQPFEETYLHAQFENGVPVGGRIDYLKIFSGVAIIILLMICINFTNLTTAKASSRVREIGIKKVVGAQRAALIFQFLGESILISFASLGIALAVVYVILPFFNVLVDKQLFLEWQNPFFSLSMVAIALITGLLAGSYPAFLMSGFRPASVLKGTAGVFGSNMRLRNALVVVQFSLTVVLVTSALVVYQQLEFIRSKNLGFNREGVLSIRPKGPLINKFDLFKTEALKNPDIQRVSRSSSSLVQINNQNGSFNWPGKPENTSVMFRTVVVDTDFLQTMEIPLVEGRYFSEAMSDSGNTIITQRAVEVTGMDNPVGQIVTQWGITGKVVGIVENVHGRSMLEALDPVIFLCRPNWTGLVFVRFNASKTHEVIDYLTALHKQINPTYPIEYAFEDDDFEQLYKTERVTNSLAIGFTCIAIIISVLGMTGLAAYTAERRKKEIGIRKTLGASVNSLVNLLTKNFLKLTLIAVLIASPIAYWLMNRFLERYAFHVELQWIIIVMVGLAVIILALLTVGYQVLRTARSNPVDSLRIE